MSKQDEHKQAEIARYTLGSALELMAEKGVADAVATRETMALAITLGQVNPKAVDADDVIKFALALIGAYRGGPQGIAAWCEETAAAIRNDPDVPPPARLN